MKFPGTLTQALQEQAAMRKPAKDFGSEPLTITPGQSLDLGPLVNDANVHDAGGYPDTSALTTPDNHKPESVPPRRTRPLRRFTTQRYVFQDTGVGTAGQAVLVTPSGIDALDIVSVSVVSSRLNRVRYGMTDNGAASGACMAWSGASSGTIIEAGPVWVVPMGDGSTQEVYVDVLVVYEDPSERATGSTPAKPCGCSK